MKTNIVIAIVLGILVLISVVQAFQLNGLKTKVSSAATTVNTASQSTPATSSPSSEASVPSNIQNLPQMVGGC